MKKLITLLCVLCLAGTLSARTQKFTIRGEIKGLEVGDTLRFERIGLPGFVLTPAFDVVLTQPDKFEYRGRQEHIEYFLMTWLSRTGKKDEGSRIGLTMIVDGGTVKVTGRLDEIYFSRVDGEAFGRKPLLREALELENSIERTRSSYLRQFYAARAAGDTLKSQEYLRQFNEFRPEDSQRRVGELHREFIRRNPSSSWSLVYMLGRSSYTPVDTLEAYYGRLDGAARKGYYGVRLGKKIDDLRRLLPGQPAPDFTVTLPDGSTMDSEDFRGKYLLIYHWGFCPGSIQREMDATELYGRHRNRLEVLGITDNLEAFAKAAQGTAPGTIMYGIDLKATYESMAAHAWIDVEDGAGENHKIGELYDFAGYPFFILVSPDGKIVSRGFHETLDEAQKILNNN